MKCPYRTNWLQKVMISLVFYLEAPINYRLLISEFEDPVKMIHDLSCSP
jgi:hypothetical protein